MTVAVIGLLAVRRLRAACSWGPGSVLVELSVVEQRYRAVLAVLAGESVTAVAAQLGVSRQSVHKWLSRYRDDGLGGLIDRSRRPESSPWQSSPEVEAAVCELRREHPRWGPRRLAHELGRVGMEPVPSRMTVYRILVRHGLVEPRKRGRRREDYKRWERDAPMALWQLDIVGGVFLADGAELKVVTGVDDHSRFCVIAQACVRATGRAVCLAFARALERYGVPDEVLTDNGKQFTARFGRGGEVLFDRICRDNGIVHRLTQPASPTTTGKIERFHQTLRRDFLADQEPFDTIEDVQAGLDGWVAGDYNTRRPHQSLDMASPADRFAPVPQQEREALPLRLPAALAAAPAPSPEPPKPERVLPLPPLAPTPGAVEFDRVVPASGNMSVEGKQFWLGPSRAGITVTFWADHDVIHLSAGGARLKSVRSHLTTADLARLAATGGRPAGPPRCRPPSPRGRRSRSTAWSPPPAPSASPASPSWPPRSSPAAGSRSASTAPPWPSSTPIPASCCEPGPATSPTTRPPDSAEPAPPGHRHGRPSSPSGSNAGPPTPGSSWSPARKSPSAGSTPTPWSRSTWPRAP